MGSERSYPVYEAGGANPSYYVNRDKFLTLTASGAARRFGRRGQSLRLVHGNARLRDASAVMGCREIEAYADGSQHIASLLTGWAPL